MLSRIISTHSRHFRHLSIPLFQPSSSTTPLPQIPNFNSTLFITRHFSSSNNNNNNNGEQPTSDFWKIASEKADLDDVFGTHDVNLTDNSRKLDKDSNFARKDSWVVAENENNDRVFEERESGGGGGGGVGVSDEWGPTTKEYQPWILEGDEKLEDLFGIDSFVGETKSGGEVVDEESEMVKAAKKLELDKEEQLLKDVLKGPNRAFGDLVAASGITDAMLDSLIALKNFEDIDGLPPLTQIEDERFAKTLQKSSRYELELQKQEEAAKSRVREVDEKGRAYGTGKRKCSIARVWIQPGEGKFSINDKEFDVYFPMLDHRAALLRPFAETKTLGLWDVKCTVKGGGTTGQVDAIRLGISRALQCWEPGLRPPLREAGFLTRDSRIVERKKPGKAKARKSFQWVKR